MRSKYEDTTRDEQRAAEGEEGVDDDSIGRKGRRVVR
jgi:hypothetical protein